VTSYDCWFLVLVLHCCVCAHHLRVNAAISCGGSASSRRRVGAGGTRSSGLRAIASFRMVRRNAVDVDKEAQASPVEHLAALFEWLNASNGAAIMASAARGGGVRIRCVLPHQRSCTGRVFTFRCCEQAFYNACGGVKPLGHTGSISEASCRVQLVCCEQSREATSSCQHNSSGSIFPECARGFSFDPPGTEGRFLTGNHRRGGGGGCYPGGSWCVTPQRKSNYE